MPAAGAFHKRLVANDDRDEGCSSHDRRRNRTRGVPRRRGQIGTAAARFQTIGPKAPFLELAKHGEIVAPSIRASAPARPEDFDTVYDLVHLYLELLETLPHEKVP